MCKEMEMEIHLRTSLRVSLATWDHTMLPATRHKRAHPALTPATGEGWYSIYLVPTPEAWKAELTYVAGYIRDGLSAHSPSSNRARRRVTTLIETNALPIIQATTYYTYWVGYWTYFYARQHICYSAYMLSPVRPSVCLSVCPSVTWVDHTETVEDRIMKFTPCGSPIPLVFRAQVSFRNSEGSPERGR